MEELNQINTPEVQKFILENKDSDIAELALKAHKYPKIPMGFVIDQLLGRSKAKFKLPTFFKHPDVVFPPKLNLEQCSSEQTASYKASILSGQRMIDLTGGFGVDDFAFSKTFESVIHCERNSELSSIVANNAKVLGINNVTLRVGDSIKELSGRYDWVYSDPARRADGNKKVFRLEDCEPNIAKQLSLFWQHTDNICIKASPIIDLKQGLLELEHVKEVHVVSVKNECKEVVFILEKGFSGEPNIVAINLTDQQNQAFQFTFVQESSLDSKLSQPLRYIYEANTSINKAGGFKSVAYKYALNKLHSNSHLYTSDRLLSEFPGRVFQNIAVVPYSKKELKKHIPDGKVNLATRNFKVSVSDIKKKMGLKDGGDVYAFATTNVHEKQVIILCKKVF